MVIISLLTHSLTHSLTPYSTVLQKLTGLQPIKKFPIFYVTWRFIVAFTSARHQSLSCAISFQCMHPHPTYWRSILILSSHLRLCLPSDLFHSGISHQEPVCTAPVPHTCYIPRSSNSRVDHLKNIGWRSQVTKLLTIYLYGIRCMTYVTEMKCVYWAVKVKVHRCTGTEPLYRPCGP